MMKKKFLFLLSLFALIGIFFVARPNQPVQAANNYGIARKYTTPLATRGIWYYRDGKKISTVKITAHSVKDQELYKLYVPSQKYFKKHVYNVSAKKRNAFIKKTKNLYAAYNFKKGFNVNNWVNLAGAGNYYLPGTKNIKSKKVAVLRLATGANAMVTAGIAYKTRALAQSNK